jgi:hypothetical protein
MMAWLNQWQFSRFVTLAFNDPASHRAGAFQDAGSEGHHRRALRKWDARVNHKLLGKNWAAMHADRTFSFYSPEKFETNPHWHGFIKFFSDDEIEVARQASLFDEYAGQIWKKIVPSGSFDAKVIRDQGPIADYILKHCIMSYITTTSSCPTSSRVGRPWNRKIAGRKAVAPSSLGYRQDLQCARDTGRNFKLGSENLPTLTS